MVRCERRRDRPRPASATPSSVSEAGSGTTDAVTDAVKVVEPVMLLRTKLPSAVGVGPVKIEVGVPVIVTDVVRS